MIIMELQDLMNKLENFKFIAMTFPEEMVRVSKQWEQKLVHGT